MSRAHLYLLVSAVLLSSALADPLPAHQQYAAIKCVDKYLSCPNFSQKDCQGDVMIACPKTCDPACKVQTTNAAPATTKPPATTTRPALPKDCHDILRKGSTSEGYYQAQRPGSTSLTSVYCVSGWEVIQRRTSGQLSFDRVYAEYQKGFGKPESEYWMGLDAMYQLTSSHKYMARVEVDVQDVTKSSWKKEWDEYESFSVGASSSGYVLSVGARIHQASTGGGDLQISSGQPFEAKDKTHTSSLCSDLFGGGFWFGESCGPNPNANECTTNTQAVCGLYGGDIRSSIILIRLAP